MEDLSYVLIIVIATIGGLFLGYTIHRDITGTILKKMGTEYVMIYDTQLNTERIIKRGLDTGLCLP